MAKVGIVMGSDSDMPVMAKAADILEELGVSCEIGVVKNQSGPFVAGLGNLDGLYGGYRVETGGDCVRIDIYTR